MHNLLFVITKSEVGGAQKFVKEQIDITVGEFNVFLCTNRAGWLTEIAKQKLKSCLLHTGIEKMSSLFFLYQLYKFIKKNNISLVITNSANAGFYGRLAAFFARVPSCYISHGWSSVYNGGFLSAILNYVENVLSKLSDCVICVSNNDYNVAINKIGIKPSKLAIVQNAIFPIAKKNTEPKFVPERKFKIIALARFARPKRIDLMIDALSKLPDIILHIAGSGTEFTQWQGYIVNKNVKNVILLGEIPAFDAFDNYDAFLLISDSEGLPISAIEAMSAGLPLILSDVGGCGELIDKNGVLVNNDSDSIVNGIRKVINNIDIFGEGSTKLFSQKFNLNSTKLDYIALYKKLL